MQPHIHNFVGRVLMEAGVAFPDETAFDLNDVLIPHDIDKEKIAEYFMGKLTKDKLATFIHGKLDEQLRANPAYIDTIQDVIRAYGEKQLSEKMKDLQASLEIKKLEYGLEKAKGDYEEAIIRKAIHTDFDKSNIEEKKLLFMKNNKIYMEIKALKIDINRSDELYENLFKFTDDISKRILSAIDKNDTKEMELVQINHSDKFQEIKNLKDDINSVEEAKKQFSDLTNDMNRTLSENPGFIENPKKFAKELKELGSNIATSELRDKKNILIDAHIKEMGIFDYQMDKVMDEEMPVGLTPLGSLAFLEQLGFLTAIK